MKDEYSELNDIILNRQDKSDRRKKMLIGVGTLAIVAIIIVIIMGRISGSAPTQLPQPVLPSEHATALTDASAPATAPAAPSTEVEQHLDAVAQNVKKDEAKQPVTLSESEVVVIDETTGQPSASAPATRQPETPAAAEPAPAQKTAPAVGSVYIQVGSFSRYKPSSAFLDGIKRSGYAYTLHRVVVNGRINNKVLVGPFKNRSDALAHLADVRRKIESGAFIYTIKP